MKITIDKISSPEAFQKCMDIRIAVFVEEQRVPMEEEMDGKDSICDHYLLSIDAAPIGTARIFLIGNIAKIGRVAIVKDYRGKGLGHALMQHMVTDIRTNHEIEKIKLSSQTYAIPFYEALGFVVCSDEYMDAGIPHKDMEFTITS